MHTLVSCQPVGAGIQKHIGALHISLHAHIGQQPTSPGIQNHLSVTRVNSQTVLHGFQNHLRFTLVNSQPVLHGIQNHLRVTLEILKSTSEIYKVHWNSLKYFVFMHIWVQFLPIQYWYL